MQQTLSKSQIFARLKSVAPALLAAAILTPSVSGAAQCSDNFYVDITLPNGARWDMCWEPRRREGITLHNIHYRPVNGPRRLVLYQASLAQVHVPYDDNGIRFHDITDYGFGGYYQQRLTNAECEGGTLLSADEKPIVCQTIRKHGEAYRFNSDSKPGYTLSLFSASKISDYTYIPHWSFADDGSIEIGIDATGVLQRLSTADAEKHGWLLETNKVGLAHLHNFYWRLDFDLNGTAADDVIEELNFAQQANQLRHDVQRFTTEASRKVNPKTLRTWRITDPTTNSNGKPIGYEIHMNQTNHQDIGPSNEPFTHNDIYFTRASNCEIFASHNPQTFDCAENLSEFINEESIQNEDIIVWPSLSFYHMPRSEDMPNMDSHRSSFKLIPWNWHDENPL